MLIYYQYTTLHLFKVLQWNSNIYKFKQYTNTVLDHDMMEVV